MFQTSYRNYVYCIFGAMEIIFWQFEIDLFGKM